MEMQLQSNSPSNSVPAIFFLIICLLFSGCSLSVGLRIGNDKSDLVVYNSPPSIEHFSLGDTDRAHGEIVSWHAGLHDAEGEGSTRLGHCNGTMQVTLDNYGPENDREHRMTMIELDWEDSNDSLLISGSHPYKSGHLETDTPIIRAIVGGTGEYRGARGEMTSEKLASGWYRHEIWLVD
ncbi:MAG: hypothetical protein P8K66_00400, partial [Planctomycetota bacterium]|nr:hypothetical protein [Planctomycetota bacterium]